LALEDPAFREYDLAGGSGTQLPSARMDYVEVRRAALMVGNLFEVVGILVKNRVVEADIFFDRWVANVTNTWKRMDRFIAWMRKAQNDDGIYENFEYLTVLAQD